MEILKKKRENSMYPEENAFRKEGGGLRERNYDKADREEREGKM